MNMMRLVKILIVYFLLLGCGDNKGSNNIVPKITRWENGKIRTEEYYVNDSIKEGTFKRYYQTGQLEDEVEYHSNKVKGQVISYYENGKAKHVIPYRNGKPWGIGWGYYENGAIKWYQVYRLFNHIGDAGFQIDYSEKGAIENVLGTAVVDLLANKDTLSIGDTLKISFQVALPKNSEGKLHFYENVARGENGIDLEINRQDGIARYQTILKEKGVLNWAGNYVIRFDDKKEKQVKFKFVGRTVVR